MGRLDQPLYKQSKFNVTFYGNGSLSDRLAAQTTREWRIVIGAEQSTQYRATIGYLDKGYLEQV